MTTDRQRFLQQQLAANSQRSARRKYLQQLPHNLGNDLEKQPFIQSPERDQLLPLFHISPDGRALASKQPDGYNYTTFNSEALLLAYIRAISNKYDHVEALFWPSLNNPIYRVAFGWARQNLYQLWSYSPQELGLVTTDQQAGIVISNYSGVIDDDPNPEGVVFECAVWNASILLH